MSELVHALVIIATTHAMSGLVFGLGINLELDLRYFAAQNYHKLGGHAGIEDQSVPSATATTTAAAATATNASEVQPSSSPTDRPSIASETTVQLLQALKGAGNECDDMESTEEEQVFAFRKIGEDGKLDCIGTTSSAIISFVFAHSLAHSLARLPQISRPSMTAAPMSCFASTLAISGWLIAISTLDRPSTRHFECKTIAGRTTAMHC